MQLMPYAKGTVYRIICINDPKIQYIGSTFNELRWRWQSHKDKYKQYLKGGKFISIYKYFTKYGLDNFKIIKIKDYLVYRENQRDHKHLSVYETLWCNKIKCINKYIPFNPLKYIDNQIRQKKLYDNNKEEINKSRREKRANETTEEKKIRLKKKNR